MNTTPRSVGRATVAIGLVAAGAALLSDNITAAGPRWTGLLLRLWPVFLIGFGLEYLIWGLLDRARRPARFDFGGALLLAGALALTALVGASVSVSPEIRIPAVDGIAHAEAHRIPAAGSDALVVDIDVGHVTLLPHGEAEVRVEVDQTARGLTFGHDGAAPRPDLEIEPGETIRVTARAATGGLHLGVWQTAYRIHAPAGLRVTVRTDAGTIAVQGYEGSLDLAADAGSITVTDSSGNLVAEAGSGSIQVARFAGPVTATTDAGAITARQVDGALTLRSGTGVITVDDHSGAEVTAETRTGSITAILVSPPGGPVTLRTHTGTIHLTMPESSDASIRASTRTGRILGMTVSGREGPASSATRTMGNGTHRVTLEANMGTIQFSTR